MSDENSGFFDGVKNFFQRTAQKVSHAWEVVKVMPEVLKIDKQHNEWKKKAENGEIKGLAPHQPYDNYFHTAAAKTIAQRADDTGNSAYLTAGRLAGYAKEYLMDKPKKYISAIFSRLKDKITGKGDTTPSLSARIQDIDADSDKDLANNERGFQMSGLSREEKDDLMASLNIEKGADPQIFNTFQPGYNNHIAEIMKRDFANAMLLAQQVVSTLSREAQPQTQERKIAPRVASTMRYQGRTR